MRTASHRALLLLAALSFCIIIPSSTLAATSVADDITTDTEWTLADSPYVINFDNNPFAPRLLSVAAGATLTIDPGVVVKFGDYNGVGVSGSLKALGTSDAPITFTSLKDDTAAGDTNGDADATTPAPKDWMHLDFYAGAQGSFDHVAVTYGGRNRLVVPTTGILNQGGDLSIDHTTFAHNGYDGFAQWSGSATIKHSQIFDQNVGINLSGGTLSVFGSHVFNNTEAGVQTAGGDLAVNDTEINDNNTNLLANDANSIAIHHSSIHGFDWDHGHRDVENRTVNTGAEITIDATNNWWGGDFEPNENYVSGAVTVAPWFTKDPFAPDPCALPGSCASNILFLPGFEGSRLYRPDGKGGVDKLWEPTSNADVNDLALNLDGTSMHADIYTKVGDVLDKLPVSGARIYQSLIDNLDGLKTAGSINDWKPIAYDWRLSLEDLLTNGTERDGKIYYGEATDTPYIEQTLLALAATSKSGKVTIIAHSNGGLLAKALLNQLGGQASKLVDKVILVGSPQSGMPLDMAALLFGTGQEIAAYKHWGLIVDVPTARAFAQNAPAAYHLLPSTDYFLSAGYDLDHPIIHFAGSAYLKEEAAYTPTILTSAALKGFLTAAEGGRMKPDRLDIKSAEVLNADLIDYGIQEHATLDAWNPPPGIQVDQIAGWGLDTISGINFYTPKFLSNARWYAPIFTEDGDDTVTTPSALMMPGTDQVKRYWLDLKSFNKLNSSPRSHEDVFEVVPLENFIKNEIANHVFADSVYVLSNRPPSSSDKKLIYVLHSPLSLQVTDSSDNVTGLGFDQSITENIPGSTYGQLGEVKYVIVPEGGQYQLTMHGLDTGTFTLDIQESVGNVVGTTTTFAEVPVTASTTATLTVSGGVETASALVVDENGDGKSVITLDPKIGDTAVYEPPAAAPVPVNIPVPAPQSSGGGGGWVIVRPVQPIATTTVATSTPSSRAATTTSVVTPLVNSGQPKTKAVAVALSKKAPTNVAQRASTSSLQTASVYSASQQSGLQKLGAAVYNGLHGFWNLLKGLF